MPMPSLAEIVERLRAVEKRLANLPLRRGRAAVPYAWFRLQSVSADYVTARRYYPDDDTVASVDEAIAKPPLLRQTRLDGTTGVSYSGWSETFDYSYTDGRERTSTRTSDSDTQTQVLTPDYMLDDGTGAGEEILAIPVPTGVTDGNGDKIGWQMVELHGRYWGQISDAESS